MLLIDDSPADQVYVKPVCSSLYLSGEHLDIYFNRAVDYIRVCIRSYLWSPT